MIGWATSIGGLWILWRIYTRLKGLMGKFDVLHDRPLSLDVSSEASGHHFALEIYSSMRKMALTLLNKHRAEDDVPPPRATLNTADLELLNAHALSTLQAQRERLHRHLYLLSTCVTLGPFLGLLGTVWGILISFGALQGAPSGPTSEGVLQGLSLALVTTVVGLFVAIPALIGYNLLRCCIGKLEIELSGFAHHLLSCVELQYRNPE